MYPVCTDNEGNPRAPGEVWNGSARSCCLYKCMENGSVVAVEPDCNTVPTPLCEREGEYVLDVVEEGACCPKKICGEFRNSPVIRRLYSIDDFFFLSFLFILPSLTIYCS